MAKSTQQIKFPVLHNVEYFDVLKNKSQVKSFTGQEVEGLKWRDISLAIGKIAGAGVYRYTFKFRDSDQTMTGSIRGVVQSEVIKENRNDSQLKNEIELLKNKIDGLGKKSDSIGVDLLISVTKQSYETQITFLNNQLSQKDISINKLELMIEKLNDELDQAYLQIDELTAKTGLGQYIELARDFLKIKLPGADIKKVSLKDSNPSDIPDEILKVLGVVDWSKVPENITNEILKYLNMFIDKLPLKGV